MRIVSPVFAKEMINLARRKRHYAARAGFLGLLLAAITFTWGNAASRDWYDASYIGHELFVTFALTQMIAVALLVPALTAPVIAAEKERDTLGLLLMTNLSHASILLDKLLSRLALVILLLFAALPLFLALLALGGITPGMIVLVYINTLAVILFTAGIGLFCSTIMDRIHTAMIATYALMAAYVLAPCLLSAMVDFDLNPTGVFPYVDDIVSKSPWSLLFPCVALIVFGLGVRLSVYLLPRVATRSRRPLIKRLFTCLNAFFHRINFTGVVVMRESRDPGENALLWKETQKYFFASRIFLLRSFYALLMLGMLAVILLNFGSGDGFSTALSSFLTCVLLVVIGLVALLTGSAALAGERDRHTFEIILTTPLTARQIILAKFAGVMRILTPLLAALAVWVTLSLCLHGLWGGGYYRYGMASPLVYLAFILGFVPAIAVIGLRASAARRSVPAAFLHAFVVFAIWSALPLVIYLINWVMHNFTSVSDYDPFYSVVNLWFRLTPVTATMQLVDRQLFGYYGPDFMLFTPLLLIPVWVISLFRLIHKFDRLMGRR